MPRILTQSKRQYVRIRINSVGVHHNRRRVRWALFASSGPPQHPSTYDGTIFPTHADIFAKATMRAIFENP